MPCELEPLVMSGFFEEVKRRKVYRVAAAYIIAAGGIIQLASAAFPAWELPNWMLRLVIVLLLMGFPIALMLAWASTLPRMAFKLTPDVAAPEDTSSPQHHHAGATGVIVSAWRRRSFCCHASQPTSATSQLQSLPFENLSDEKENAYFADGIQDDVLTNLSKVGDLKVHFAHVGYAVSREAIQRS